MVYSKLMCEVVTLPAHWTKNETEETVAKEKGRKKEEMRQKYRRKIAHTHHTFMPSLSLLRKRASPIKNVTIQGRGVSMWMPSGGARQHHVLSIHGELHKAHARCHMQKISEWWGNHGARRYRTQRRGEIKSTPARFVGRATAAKLNVEKNRENIIWEGKERKR